MCTRAHTYKHTHIHTPGYIYIYLKVYSIISLKVFYHSKNKGHLLCLYSVKYPQNIGLPNNTYKKKIF